MTRNEKLIDELLKSCKKPEDILGEGGLLKQLTKERALEAEMTDHLGYSKYSSIGKSKSNSRNGKTSKTIKGKSGEMTITVPRDREGEFEPQLIPKHQRRFDGFAAKAIANSLVLKCVENKIVFMKRIQKLVFLIRFSFYYILILKVE